MNLQFIQVIFILHPLLLHFTHSLDCIFRYKINFISKHLDYLFKNHPQGTFSCLCVYVSQHARNIIPITTYKTLILLYLIL